jgi:beta-galactosidase
VADQPAKGLTRRRFLTATGAGALGVASLGIVLGRSDADPALLAPGASWKFGRYTQGCLKADFDEGELVEVTVPHCVTPLSWQDWDPTSWESLWVYRQHFDASAALRAGRVFVAFDGVMSSCTVHLNGRKVGEHYGGYLPFSCELTGSLAERGNVLAVAVDGRWDQDTPPDLPRFTNPAAIDFYQPAGMYRAAAIVATPRAHLTDVFAEPADVLTPERRVTVSCVLDSDVELAGAIEVSAELTQDGPVLDSAAVDLVRIDRGRQTVSMTLSDLAAVRLWDIDEPTLCQIAVTLTVNGRTAHRVTVRTGLREARFTPDGFFLNGRRVKLFGLNRHQWFPFTGGAMPDRMQRRDAEQLKNELHCTMVRCSHYPQAPAFLDACDELGLLVWEEIPGWDYIGDAAWQVRALQDVHDMVVRDRNHPSIIVWGSRVNETHYDLPLYDRTDALAEQLDPTRPTTGALANRSGYFAKLDPAQDGDAVFSFNDYSRGPNPAAPVVLRPPRTGVPYLVSESIGTLVGPKTFRRTDSVAIQTAQASLHGAAHNLAGAEDRYCGLLAWSAFDYPSGWLHSRHGMKSPGVADFFRIAKLGAAMYHAQTDPRGHAVIAPDFYWDFGPRSDPAGPGPDALIWSNCDRLAVYLDGHPAGPVRRQTSRFRHLPHPPFTVDLSVRPGTRPTLRIDGFLGGRRVTSRQFSADPALDVLTCAADDATLRADGVDMTRVVVRAVDAYGAPRPYVAGGVSFGLSGPGLLIGDNPFDLEAAGGAGAVWLRTLPGQPGVLTLQAAHPTLGFAATSVTTVLGV